ncbi:MAG: helix-turn-helix transcriptional regulator [Rhodothermales bacterium]
MNLLTRPEEFVMLAIWKLQDRAYSLPIRKQVADSTGIDWSLSSIYTPLDRLTKKGLLTSYLTDPLPERGGRPRRIYQLTPEGRKALLSIRTVEQSMWAGITGLTAEGN